jgi:hypothetical protein
MPNGTPNSNRFAPISVFPGRGQPNVFPMKNRIDKGYGVKTPSQYPKLTNARLVNQLGQSLDFYVTDMEIGLEMAGSTAQSESVKQFFPSNFVQPSMTITGIAPNSFQYNRFANFVRMSHHWASRGNQKERLVRFQLSNGEGRAFPYDGKRPGGPRDGRQVTKGIHKAWDVAGQIQGAQAGGRKENHAPEFQFTFMIFEVKSGPWTDQSAELETVASWMAIFKSLSKKDKRKMFVQPFSETGQNTPAKKPQRTRGDFGRDWSPQPWTREEAEDALDGEVYGPDPEFSE